MRLKQSPLTKYGPSSLALSIQIGALSNNHEIDTNRESSLTHHEPTVLPSFSTTERDASCRRDGSILCPRFGSLDPKERDLLRYLIDEQLCIFCLAEKVSERFTFSNQSSLGLPATNRRCNGCHARNALESGVNVFLSGRLTIAYVFLGAGECWRIHNASTLRRSCPPHLLGS